ncbi:MAG: hypothetical protein ACRCZP_11550 [Phycicoccus sp.]
MEITTTAGVRILCTGRVGDEPSRHSEPVADLDEAYAVGARWLGLSP